MGTVFVGKYRLDRIIGEGGMGVVFEAVHLRLRQRVAIKMLQPHVLGDPEFVARFEREARAVATLESPNVAKVLDVDTSPEGLPFMVIEFLEGDDLADELERRGKLPTEEAVALVMEACVPIAQAHALGIVHRDLKPSNLFLATKGRERVLNLLDFGISKVTSDAESKLTSTALGTPDYMSPEQIRQSSDVDARADIWSLGIILYELLTGVTPFTGHPSAVIAAITADPIPPPRSLREDIPGGLEKVILRALEKDPRNRFPDIRSLSIALAPFAPEEELVPLSSVPVAPPPSSLPPRTHSEPPLPLIMHVRKGTPRDEPIAKARQPWPWLVVPAAIALIAGGAWLGAKVSATAAPTTTVSTPSSSLSTAPPDGTVNAVPPPTTNASSIRKPTVGPPPVRLGASVKTVSSQPVPSASTTDASVALAASAASTQPVPPAASSAPAPSATDPTTL